PAASAASSSTRLEMLLEPGKATTPCAWRARGRSRYGCPVMAKLLLAPVAARLRGAFQQRLEGAAVAGRHGLLGLVQHGPYRRQLGAQGGAVGQENVAPHFGRP